MPFVFALILLPAAADDDSALDDIVGLLVKGKGSVESRGRRDWLARNPNGDKFKHVIYRLVEYHAGNL